jgi:hypothetical protein
MVSGKCILLQLRNTVPLSLLTSDGQTDSVQDFVFVFQLSQRLTFLFDKHDQTYQHACVPARTPTTPNQKHTFFSLLITHNAMH